MAEIDLGLWEIRARSQGLAIIADGVRGAAALLREERDVIEQAGIRLVQFEQLPMQHEGLFEILLAESDRGEAAQGLSPRRRAEALAEGLLGKVDVAHIP